MRKVKVDAVYLLDLGVLWRDDVHTIKCAKETAGNREFGAEQSDRGQLKPANMPRSDIEDVDER